MKYVSFNSSAGCAICIGACVVLLFAAGCKDGRPSRVPISGQVLIDGTPLRFGSVMFIPPGSRPSSGKIDENGRFSLSCYDGGDGAVLGKHAVKVICGDQIDDSTIKWHAPKKYADHRTSGLEVEVDGPTDSLKIELTWAGGKPFVEK